MTNKSLGCRIQTSRMKTASCAIWLLLFFLSAVMWGDLASDWLPSLVLARTVEVIKEIQTHKHVDTESQDFSTDIPLTSNVDLYKKLSNLTQRYNNKYSPWFTESKTEITSFGSKSTPGVPTWFLWEIYVETVVVPRKKGRKKNGQNVDENNPQHPHIKHQNDKQRLDISATKASLSSWGVFDLYEAKTSRTTTETAVRPGRGPCVLWAERLSKTDSYYSLMLLGHNTPAEENMQAFRNVMSRICLALQSKHFFPVKQGIPCTTCVYVCKPPLRYGWASLHFSGSSRVC